MASSRGMRRPCGEMTMVGLLLHRDLGACGDTLGPCLGMEGDRIPGFSPDMPSATGTKLSGDDSHQYHGICNEATVYKALWQSGSTEH